MNNILDTDAHNYEMRDFGGVMTWRYFQCDIFRLKKSRDFRLSETDKMESYLEIKG